MKKILSFFVLMMVFTSTVCSAAWVYPEYSGVSANVPVKNERINIVFDNSGHEYVKKMLVNTLIAASVAENTDIWIYPVAGSNEPIKVEPTKEFVEANFNKYTKSSNEFKEENMLERAVNELVNDTTIGTKRLIMYVDDNTSNMRSEYSKGGLVYEYMDAHPDVKFTTFDSFGGVYSPFFSTEQRANYEKVSGEDLPGFVLVKNGYSKCEATYNQESGVVTIDKNKADSNIFVLAVENGYGDERTTFLGGCLMDADAYKSYLGKSKVKGVALSYNHIVADHHNENSSFAAALYTIDGDTINPQTEAICIPVKNADEVTVYHRETKGVGVCSADTTYKASQDKDIVNVYAPEGEEIPDTSIGATLEDESMGDILKSEESVVKKVFNIIKLVIGFIISWIFRIIKIGIFVLIVACIVSGKVRSYLQLKILGSKLGPTYEKIIVKIKTVIKDVSNAGKKIKGNADLNGKYVFISKASADMIVPNNRIELLICELEKRGISCWTSEKGIKPGQNYNLILPEAIRRCALFLLFVSPMSVKSPEVVSEIGTAKEYKKEIIPVQIEPFDLFKDFPDWAYMLKQYQKTDLFRSKPEEIKSLADFIEQTFNEIK